MPSIGYPLIKFGASTYLTDDNLSTGDRYIASVDGLDKLALTHNIGTTRGIDGTVYPQYQAVKDTEIVVRVPRMDFTKCDAIRDIINTAIAGNTTYALDITVNGESFTFTAKPGGVTYSMGEVADHVEDVEITQFCTD